MTVRDLVIDAFAGMGGWDEAALALGISTIGIEYDEGACHTRAAAGHHTIRADVAAFPLGQLDGRVAGLIMSPPCPAFSQSGLGLGVKVMPLILDAIDGLFADDPSPMRVLHERCEDPTALLVTEPARWALALRPRWIALEQVPPVLPIWNRLAHHLGELGYSTWAGVLNSADYGVPQTRERAILIASLDRTVGPPAATHAKHPMPSLFGPELHPWVSMAQALGWTPRIDERYFDPETEPAQVVCGNITPRWAFPRKGQGIVGSHLRERVEAAGIVDGETLEFGDVVQAHGTVRDVDTEPAPTITASADNGNFQFRVGFPQLDDIGDSPDGYRERDWRDGDEPAFTLTEKARSWVVQTGNNSHVTSREGSKAGEGGVELYERSVDEPAPTLDTNAGGKWRIQPDALNTGKDWKKGGTRDDAQTIPVSEPAPTIVGGHGGASNSWWVTRPATTVQGDPRNWPPGHKINADDERRLGTEAAEARYGDRAGSEAIRLTIIDALILQSFHPAYPVQGNKTKQFEQVGNAIPPLLALHVLREAIG